MPPGPYPIASDGVGCDSVLDAAGIESAHVYRDLDGRDDRAGVDARESQARAFADSGLHRGRRSDGRASRARSRPRCSWRAESMSPEEAAEAAIPFIYDPATPRATDRRRFERPPPVAAAPGSLHGAASGNSRVGSVQPLAADHRADSGDSRRARPAGSARQRQADREPYSRRQAGHAIRTPATSSRAIRPEEANRAILDFLASQTAQRSRRRRAERQASRLSFAQQRAETRIGVNGRTALARAAEQRRVALFQALIETAERLVDLAESDVANGKTHRRDEAASCGVRSTRQALRAPRRCGRRLATPSPDSPAPRARGSRASTAFSMLARHSSNLPCTYNAPLIIQ